MNFAHLRLDSTPGVATELVANATILCVDDAGVPATALAPGDIVSTSCNYAGGTAASCAALT